MESRPGADLVRRPADPASGRQREDDGLVVVDAARRVRLVDHRARDLLAGTLALGDAVPGFLLAASTVSIRPAAGGPDVELRIASTRVDGAPGWTISVADVSGRRPSARVSSGYVESLCHELRTPLTSILGYADVLREGNADLDADERAGFLAIIIRQAGRMARMTSDLAVLSRAGRGLRAAQETVELDAAIADVLAALREEAADVAVTGDRGLAVHVDDDHLAHVLTNLLTNARKYGRPPVVVEVERQDFQAVVRVRDAGPGVPDGFVPRMWDRFARAREVDGVAGIPGTGLGLAIVAGLVAVNGGHAWYERNDPTGSVFCVSFPLAGDGPGGN